MKYFAFKTQGLEFTVSAPAASPAASVAPADAGAAAAAPSPVPALNLERIQKQLEDMMKKADDDEIDKWIQVNDEEETQERIK